MTVKVYVGFSGSFQTFFFPFPKTYLLFLVLKGIWGFIPVIAKIIHTLFFIQANENWFSQIRLMWSLNEKIVYAELPGSYFFLLGKAFAKGGCNWLVNLNRSHLIFQDLKQHKFAFDALIGIWLKQMLYSTHFIS